MDTREMIEENNKRILALSEKMEKMNKELKEDIQETRELIQRERDWNKSFDERMIELGKKHDWDTSSWEKIRENSKD